MLELKKISRTYKMGKVEVKALKEVTFKVDNGEFVGIIGPSGSGKSTLMHIIGCLDHPTTGSYLIEGEDISKVNDNKLAEIRNKNIGFVFQQFNLLSRTTILHNVEIPLIYARINAKERKKLATASLEELGLAGRLRHRPNEISGGEMQRVAIARALTNSPKVIFADEPTGDLDSVTGKQVMDLLKKFHEETRTTVILITHEQDIADYAERQIIMEDGIIHYSPGVLNKQVPEGSKHTYLQKKRSM